MRLQLFDILGGLFGAGVILFLLFTLNDPPALPQVSDDVAGTVRHVVDGDSIYVAGHDPQIRLWGVDAPERDEAGFSEATATLTQLAKGKRVTCQQKDQDRYGRTVARCFLPNGQEINRVMIESGTAQEYVRFSRGFYSGDN
ncbi:thermonuclease family protein [Sulfitobacter geojensis]|uniref:Thermonuclease family protein n=3 Tax=Sulfitobacter geojensis TaxID=1342299 RepID=A0AAE3B857_9RHOB|nr:thermonuclease family protein [Sulfitobacter geojensis]MBM1691618.1 thermonuclease family protein [Sulfitobacter geojensis]MBM1695685.1 thermonuclease family protein [Sulfitobacter geojensis]MBM1707849.1 thermonuclease family protein [Sulfitobacter geojensis]MBM1711911.1 thermonuclease family protein [Sulfitobacter geojensis]MBM1715977.1 thermonuclease family protein [Sulfitobacter geojensis]